MPDAKPAPLPPQLSLPASIDRSSINASKITTTFLTSLSSHLSSENTNTAPLSSLFISDCWWRDVLCLSWDITVTHGLPALSTFLGKSKSKSAGMKELVAVTEGPLAPQVVDMGGAVFVQSAFVFETGVGKGKGIVRLVWDGGEWRAWTVSSELGELKEKEGGGKEEEGGGLQVLVVGAGHSGLALAAQLKHMGVSYVVVERSSRIGDNWRNRYSTLKTHTVTYADHLPFFPFPSDADTPTTGWKASEVGNWLGKYAEALQLKTRLSTSVKSAKYDELSRHYEVEVISPSGTEILRPKHLVLASGLFSSKPIIPDIPNRETFNGTVLNTASFTSASKIPDLANKKIAIIGTGTSAHDIALDCTDSGAKAVFLIQRGPIFSVTLRPLIEHFYAMYNPQGPFSLSEADLLGGSFPVPVIMALNLGGTKAISEHDKQMLDGLEEAGMAVRRGDDGVSIVDYLLNKMGSFYLDQGANAAIIEGRIKIRRCTEGVKSFMPKGVVLADGQAVEADVVVLCSGFHRCERNVEDVLGKEFLGKLKGFGELDEVGERLGWSRPTGAPGFWYFGSNFMWARGRSLELALQIKAVEDGLNEEHYERAL